MHLAGILLLILRIHKNLSVFTSQLMLAGTSALKNQDKRREKFKCSRRNTDFCDFSFCSDYPDTPQAM